MALQPKMRYLLLRGLLPLLVVFSFHTAYTQVKPPMFQVIHLPRKTGYSKEKLNAELLPLRDKEAVKKLLRIKNFSPGTTVVLQINRPNAQAAYWTINTSAPTNNEETPIVLQSRDNTGTKIFKVAEFKNFFRDTLAVIDTLSLELFIHDADYPDNQYQLASRCATTQQNKPVPFVRGRLFFTKELVASCTTAPVSLYNSNNRERVLASCQLNFLTPDQQETLLSLAAFLTKQTGNASKEVAVLVYSYSLTHFGRLYFPQLLSWLEKNNALSQHGDHK